MQQGTPGTHVDAWSASNGSVVTRSIELSENTPDSVFGRPAVVGNTPGQSVTIPTSAIAASQFMGVIMNNFLAEHDLADGYILDDKSAVGVMDWGRAWVLIPDGVTPNYGDPLHVVIADEEAFFSNTGGVAVPGRFLHGGDGIAAVDVGRRG
jgi:hypothetical protein